MAARVDVVVVGAGSMGSATAWWLARRGVDVVLLEQFELGHDRGSSHGETRIFRFAYPEPRYVELAMEALPLWRELEADAGRTLLETTGAVDHGDPAAIAATAAALDACGAPYELLTPAEAAERWPAMRFDTAALFHPDGGRCLAGATVAALQERAAAHGAVVRGGVGPASVSVAGDGVVVRTPGGGSWEARVAVVTAGAWVGRVLDGVAPVHEHVVTREQIQHFAPLDETAWPSFIHHRAPWTYGLLTPGVGVKVGLHHTGPQVDPDTAAELDDAMATAAADYVRQWFPGLDPTPLARSRCLYTTTPDESFVLERHGPVVVGSPCSGHGFKFTPRIGQLLADLATNPRQ